MRVIKTGNFRRAGFRGRYAGPAWPPVLPSWAREWLSVCQRHPAAQWARAYRRELAELALYVGAYLVYVFSRGLVYDDPRAVGIVNGESIVALQERLGFLWEPGWQAWAIEHVRGIVVFLNWAYIVTYWPVILALAIFLFLRNRREYYYYRTVVLLDLIAALAVFALFPVASPFAIPTVELTDTIQVCGPAFYGSDMMATFYNTSAAMPSLHFSWTVILGVYWWRTLPGGFKAAGVVYPVLTFFAITVTGNHFILDAIAGGVLAGLCFGLVEGWRRLTPRLESHYRSLPHIGWRKVGLGRTRSIGRSSGSGGGSGSGSGGLGR